VTDAPLMADGPGLRTAQTTGTRWLEHLRLWRPQDVDTIETGAHETAVILLRGTFDLMAGTTSWPARGARQSEFAGRAMAVFLPPATPFRVGGGPPDGEILMISARQPVVDEVAGKAVLSHKPLLPLAGSDKSFDPSTGEWKPAETFATAAESLPPRRFERLQVGEVAIERIFAEGYKAATISLDEAVIGPHASLCLADVPSRPSCDEMLLFVRSEGGDDRARWFPTSEADTVTITSNDAPTYVVVAYAGKQKS